jgi:hypothetical protein
MVKLKTIRTWVDIFNIINIIIFIIINIIINKFEKKNIITIEKNYRFHLKGKIKNYYNKN